MPAARARIADSPAIAGALAYAGVVEQFCARALGEQVISALLHGSLTLHDFVPGRSDIDLLVIVERPLSDREIAALTSTVAANQRDAPTRVDLRVVTRQVASRPTPSPPMEMYVAFEAGLPMHIETHNTGEPDLVVEFSMCRAHGRALAGADAREIIGPVPDEWVIALGDDQLAAWQALTDDSRHAELMVLTACRIWRFGVERNHSSKVAAGEWALARDPSLDAVRSALRQRTIDPSSPIRPDAIARLLTIVREEIASLGALPSDFVR